MNGYQFVKAFYNEVASNEAMQVHCKPHHQSLYTWICELRNRVQLNQPGREIIDLPVHYTMEMSFIGSAHTLGKAIDDLESWGIITVLNRVKGQNTKVRLSIAFMQKHCKSDANEVQMECKSSANEVQTTKTDKTDKTKKTKGGGGNAVAEEQLPKPYHREAVDITEEQYGKLFEKHGEPITARSLDKLSTYKIASGKKYKSDYHAILNWVIARVQEEMARETRNHRPSARTNTQPAPPPVAEATYGDMIDKARAEAIKNGTFSEQFGRQKSSRHEVTF